jgi:hypothetical protein
MAENDTTKRASGGWLEVDSGMLVHVQSSDGTTTYATIYQPPVANPPLNFTSANVYYYVTAQIPSGATNLNLRAEVIGSNDPGFTASSAVTTASSTFTEQGPGSAPSSSASLWVKGNASLAVEWGLTGTGTSVTGSATWWKAKEALIGIVGNNPVSNHKAVNSGVTFKATDSF